MTIRKPCVYSISSMNHCAAGLFFRSAQKRILFAVGGSCKHLDLLKTGPGVLFLGNNRKTEGKIKSSYTRNTAFSE